MCLPDERTQNSRSSIVSELHSRYMAFCMASAYFTAQSAVSKLFVPQVKGSRFQPVTPLKITLVERLLCAQEQPVA